jgi:hypothetical protein
MKYDIEIFLDALHQNYSCNFFEASEDRDLRCCFL